MPRHRAVMDSHIPHIIHQAVRSQLEELRWSRPIASVRQFHPGWQRIAWTDEAADAHVAEHWPQLLPIFRGFPRGIMRADVIRYVAMHDIGGLYCDLDYEFLRPYDYSKSEVVFSLEFDRANGDARDQIAGHIFASAPGHPFWRDVLDNIMLHPPKLDSKHGVVVSTGPGLLSRIYFANGHKYRGVCVTPRSVFSPERLRGRNEREQLLADEQTIGFHHACGSWKQRWTLRYFRHKWNKISRRFTSNRAA
jgi:mannosyltransferase OCH1-like enzyme